MKIILAVCLVLAMASASYAYALPEVTGNWEGTNLDGWFSQNGAVLIPGMTNGVTLDAGSLGVVTDLATPRNPFLKKEWGGWWQETPFTNATQLTIDVTMIASEWVLEEGAWIAPLSNIIPDGAWGQWFPEQWEPAVDLGNWTPADGDKTFHYTFNIPALGFSVHESFTLVTNSGGVITQQGFLYLDNAWIIPEPATMALMGLGGLALLHRKK